MIGHSLRAAYNRLTLTQQWIVVALLAVLPLLSLLAYSAWSMATLSNKQQRLLEAVTRLNQIDAAIQGQLSDMERISRQYLLIGEADFIDIFHQRLDGLADYQINLVLTFPGEAESNTLGALVGLVSDLANELDKPSSDVDTERFEQLWRDINATQNELSEQIEEYADRSMADNRAEVRQVQGRLAAIGAATIVATIILIAFSSIAVTKPVRRLATAINRIGHQEWNAPMEKGGPRDIVSLGEQLEWMRAQLLAADQQKQAFLHHITHELKTPLAAIMEAESLMRDEVPGPITANQGEVLGILRKNARGLQSLIQQLLNYNAIKHSHATELQAVNLRALCQDIVETLATAGPENGSHYQFRGEWDSVPSDPQCLEMILSNLLGNARRSIVSDGTVCVAWGGRGAHWWLQVVDDGAGIHPQDQPHIFKPFYQGSSAAKGHLKGSGMGLAIVKECVVRLGGRIDLKSQPGTGTTFTMHFPMELNADDSTRRDSAPADASIL